MGEAIAAIASPLGTGAISTIRVSGDDSWNIVQSTLKKPITSPKPRKIYMNTIRDEKGDIDQVLLAFYKSPKSYTGENMVEIFCHGGYVVTSLVLQTILKAGARQAKPGEFTRRAFLNGKMDLSEAEAVRDLIEAKSSAEVRAFVKGIEGKIREFVEGVREDLIEILAEIEVELDYPEEIEVDRERIGEKVKRILLKMGKVLERAKYSVRVSHGIKVAIVGKPNVGKSTLLNRLLREERAIVTPIPGTTRDVISEDIVIFGRHFKLSDTAGFRKTEDHVEIIGVERAKREIERADLVLMLIDATDGFTEQDREILEEIGEKPRIIIINKTDLKDIEVPEQLKDEVVVKISALNGEGMKNLEKKMVEITQEMVDSLKAEVVLTSQRQKELVQAAYENLIEVRNAFEQGFPTDVAAINIREALKNLDEITGRNFTEDLLDSIFSNFCVGK